MVASVCFEGRTDVRSPLKAMPLKEQPINSTNDNRNCLLEILILFIRLPPWIISLNNQRYIPSSSIFLNSVGPVPRTGHLDPIYTYDDFLKGHFPRGKNF